MKVFLKGTQLYWFHEELIQIIRRRTRWEEQKTKDFLLNNPSVIFNDLTPADAAELMEEIEAAGFTQTSQRIGKDIHVTLGMAYEGELKEIRKGIQSLSTRLERMEISQNSRFAPSADLKRSEIYQNLLQEKTKTPSSTAVLEKKSAQEETKGVRTEKLIGQYFLSLIGFAILAMGISLFVAGTIVSVGPVGKLLTGVCSAVVLICVGNFLASRNHSQKWAMAALGSGWAILYFTVFASYQIPVVKVIHSPLIALLALLTVAACSIAQSLCYRSRILIFFSYFLAYVLMGLGEVSLYTLAGSFFLGISLLIVTRKTGLSWLALLGVLAVYWTHWGWLEPSIYHLKQGFNGEESFFEALILPWRTNEWRIYPLIDVSKSMLHQAFLIGYWGLFTCMGFLPSKEEKWKSPLHVMLLLNSFIFTASYIHHLHVYYPQMKCGFSLLMGAVFLALSLIKKRCGKPFPSDLYLAFSISLFAMAVTLYFDGLWITYGWILAVLVLVWLGIRHQHFLLRAASWVLVLFVDYRLTHYDYLANDLIIPGFQMKQSFPVFMLAGLVFFFAYTFYRRDKKLPLKETLAAKDVLLIHVFAVLGIGVLMTGYRWMASWFWILEGVLLVRLGVTQKRPALKIAAVFLICLGSLRLITIDDGIPLQESLWNLLVAVRYLGNWLAMIYLLITAEWVRRQRGVWENGRHCVPYFAGLAGILLLFFFSDKGIASWTSCLWGITGFVFVAAGFSLREKIYRWVGLGIFGCVVLRFCVYDFFHMKEVFAFFALIGLGIALIVASIFYSQFSKRLQSN